jgi:hypothetical protein
VKQSDLGEFEENAREKKYTIYKAKAPTPPQAKLYGWQTPIPPTNQQIEKNQEVW